MWRPGELFMYYYNWFSIKMKSGFLASKHYISVLKPVILL